MANADSILRNLIDKIASEQGLSGYNVEITPISSGGANYTSILFLITVSTAKKELKLFAKVASMGEKLRESTFEKAFDTERYFYTKLSNIYRDIENQYKVPAEHRINIPKYYANNPKLFEETIILEDLVSEGYSVYDRTLSMDWAYASKAVEEIAKLHALSHAFAKEKPEEFEEALKLLKFDINMTDEQQKVFFEKSFKSAVEVAKDEHKEKILDFIKNINLSGFEKFLTPLKNPVLIHRDYRISNQMYKINEDGSITIKMMDFQTMQGGSPIMDLLYLIFTGTDESFRRQYYQKLMDHYYDQLSAALKRLDINPDDVYSREDYKKELNDKLLFGLVVAILTLPMVTVEAEHAPVMGENADISSFSISKVGDMYPERMRGVISDFVRWGLL